MVEVKKTVSKSKRRVKSSSSSSTDKPTSKKELASKSIHASTPIIGLRAVAIVIIALAMLVLIGIPKNSDQKTSAITEQGTSQVLPRPEVLTSSSTSATAAPANTKPL